MGAEFEVASCHCNRAGRAYVTVKQPATGAVVVFQHLPFEHCCAESVQEEQHRIVTEAARIAREATEFLAAQTKQLCSWPTMELRPGPSPREGESPNAFGFPIGRG